MNLNDMRTLLRRDLHDEDASNYRWTNNELDRHISHTVRDLSVSVPLEAKALLTTVAGSRDLSLTSLTDLIAIDAVEYPIDKYPAVYIQFSRWANTLTLLIDKAPSGGESVRVYYGKVHTLDATTSTVPTHLEELVTIGSAGYAALEWATFATNRLNVGGDDTWQHYLAWGRERLAAFERALARLSVKNALRAVQLYTPAQPKPSQTTDWGP